MTVPHALVRLRYRPAADVLVGQVELRDNDPQPIGELVDAAAVESAAAPAEAVGHLEQLDADTSLSWQRHVHGPAAGRWVLQGFQVLGARTRLGQGHSPLERYLSERIRVTAVDMIASATTASSNLPVDDRVRTRAEAELDVPVVELVRADTAPLLLAADEVPAAGTVTVRSSPAEQPRRTSPAPTADLGAARALSAALIHLADAVEGGVGRRPTDHPGAGEPHARRFVRSVRTLAAVVSRHRRAAPAAASAVAEHVRGGLPISGPERALLRHALSELDHVHTWRATARSIEALASSLDGGAGSRPATRR